MHPFIIGLATCSGCLAGLGTGGVMKLWAPEVNIATPVLVVGGICVALWVLSMISPMFPPLYKLLGPTALALVGAAAFGMVGFGVGFAIAAALQLVADYRRFAEMEMTMTMGFNMPGVTPVEKIIAREAVSLVVAAFCVGVLLKASLGVEWLGLGSGRFAEWVPGESSAGSLLGLTLLGGVLGGVRQGVESVAAYLTASGVR